MAEKSPDLANLSTMWYATSETGERTQVAYVTEVPALEEAPDATAETSGSPLVQYFTGKLRITLDTMTPDEFMQDTITLYKTSELFESDGFPTA